MWPWSDRLRRCWAGAGRTSVNCVNAKFAHTKLWPLRASITQQALAMDRSHAPRCRVGQIYAVGVRCWAGSTAGNPTSALTLPPECLRSRLSGLPSLSPRYFQSGHVPLRDPSAETQPWTVCIL